LLKGVTEIDILQLVDRLEELLERGWRLPLSGRVVIDEDTFLNIVDQMRISVPQEIKQAREVREERDKYVGQAHEEARRIIAQAREDAAHHLNSHQLRKAAEAEAESILKRAQEEVSQIRAGADQYAEDRLTELAESLAQVQEVIWRGIEALKKRQGEEVEAVPDRERALLHADEVHQQVGWPSGPEEPDQA